MKRLMSVILVGVMILTSATAFADTFYATKNGKKYHHADCPLIQKRSPAAISQEDAEQKGLKPCGKCFKESAMAIPNQKSSLVKNGQR